MAKLFCIVPIVGGAPDVDPSVTPYKGYVLCDQVGGFGAYLFSGTGAQLTALNALPQVVGIVAVTENGGTKWAELDGTIAPAVRTKLNTWLTNRGYPNIPAGWSYRQVINAVYQRVNDRFSLDNFDVAD
jgi:hypothetical protein